MRIRKLNNQGSTLLTVIIILAFIGILGSMMLSVTMTNLQMKLIERKAKENFYTCEATMDEIRTGLHELTIEKISKVYKERILSNMVTYITYTDEDFDNILKNMVISEIVNELGDTIVTETDIANATVTVGAINNQIFDDYLTELPMGSDITRAIEIGDIITTPNKGIVISNIDVNMTINEFRSRITTDIVIELPNFINNEGLQTIEYRMNQPYENYVLVADGEIISNNASGNNIINGSVYAGDGITIDSHDGQNHSIIVNGANIVTKDIKVIDYAKLEVNSGTATDTEGLVYRVPAMVWANNIETLTNETNPSSSLYSTSIDIDGVCIVKDDLSLNARYSNVILSGAYVGYSSTSTSEGSSIIVNGHGSSLDLFGLQSLTLAGRAHVSVSDNYGGNISTDIMTGESLGIKSNQSAYLIPGRFIKDIGHNPILGENIVGDKAQVDFNTEPEPDIEYTLYVEEASPFKIASKQTTQGNLFYYYLGFTSGKKADDYLRKYIEKYPNILDNTYPFELDRVRLPDASCEITAAGNLMSYNDSANPKIDIIPGISARSEGITDIEINNEISGFLLDNDAFTASELKPIDRELGSPYYKVGDLNSLYNRISQLLTLNSNRSYDGSKAVEAKVKPSSIDNLRDWLISNPISGVRYFGAEESFIAQPEGNIILVNGNANILADFTGLMLVNGDVIIGDNVSIDGMIIAIGRYSPDRMHKIITGNSVSVTGKLVSMGNIELGSYNTFNNYDNPENDTLEYIFTNYNKALNHIFKNMDHSVLYERTVPADNLVDLSTNTMLHYRNWRSE